MEKKMSSAERIFNKSQHQSNFCECHKLSKLSIRSAQSNLSSKRKTTLYEIGNTLADFAGNTSAHGIPRAYNSPGRLRRFLWLLLFLCCLIAFSGQAYLIVKRFFRNDIIVGVELKFENIPFPSVTVCNLNPYKNSLAREMASVSETLLAYDSAMAAITLQNDYVFHRIKRKSVKKNITRRDGKRQWFSRFEGLLAVFSFCNCHPQSLMGCQALKDLEYQNGTSHSTLCLCFYNPQNEQVWPCFEAAQWQESWCQSCTSLGNCAFEQSALLNKSDSMVNKNDKGTPNWPCLCAPAIRICVRIEENPRNMTKSNKNDNQTLITTEAPLIERVPKIWELKKAELFGQETQEQMEARHEAYGLRGISDQIVIRAKAMENLVFAVSQLNETEKRRMGYSKQEFIKKCSFNGRECSVEDDFSLYVDPIYGNCFTFNAFGEGSVRTERAGPNYGLRFQVFVNVSDYLPTTEAAGVQIAVHSPEEQPFPDTHGHSAPTGFKNSFGIRLKRVNRLPAPYGDCVEYGKTAEYIYKDKEYSTEGCQRSCIQRLLVQKCGCGDPRFPHYLNYSNCPVGNPKLRACLKREFKYSARSATQPDCVCRQPCREQVYSITYSCARWPSSQLVLHDSGDCDPVLSGAQCLSFHREQSALVEVYFEQLNYENLQESEAYGLPNLLSDFGGQLGLWMGVSVITIMEIGILISELLIRFVLFPCANFLRQIFESEKKFDIDEYDRDHHCSMRMRKVIAHKRSFIQWIDEDADETHGNDEGLNLKEMETDAIKGSTKKDADENGRYYSII